MEVQSKASQLDLGLGVVTRSEEAMKRILELGRFDWSFMSALVTGLSVGGLQALYIILFQYFPLPLVKEVTILCPYYWMYIIQKSVIDGILGILTQWILLTCFVIGLARLFFKHLLTRVKLSDLFKLSGYALTPLALVPALQIAVRFWAVSFEVQFLAYFTGRMFIVFYAIWLWATIIRVCYQCQAGEEFLISIPVIVYYLLTSLPPMPIIYYDPVLVKFSALSVEGTRFQTGGSVIYSIYAETVLLTMVLALALGVLYHLRKRTQIIIRQQQA